MQRIVKVGSYCINFPPNDCIFVWGVRHSCYFTHSKQPHSVMTSSSHLGSGSCASRIECATLCGRHVEDEVIWGRDSADSLDFVNDKARHGDARTRRPRSSFDAARRLRFVIARHETPPHLICSSLFLPAFSHFTPSLQCIVTSLKLLSVSIGHNTRLQVDRVIHPI